MESQNKNILENIGQSIRRSVTLKLLSIFILMLLLMIPMSFVESLIHEREMLRQEAVNEVSNKWANQQDVYGPILTIPFDRKVLNEDDEVETIREEAHILPSILDIQGKIDPQSLHRGIYEVVVYDSKISFKGKFDNIKTYLKELEEHDVKWEEAFLTINVSDLRGIKEKIIVKWNDQNKTVDPGTNIPEFISSGVTVNDIFGPEPDINGSNTFSFDLNLQGSQYLGFVPLGKETKVNLSSQWQDPSFSGYFIPDTREVDDSGFTADWKILELNRNYPQFWIGKRNIRNIHQSAFGVDLLLPMNDYQKATRSAKYALLAISLTFLTFFLVEIFNQKKVHPFQYILIGLALTLFYTLLVSISEHTNFNLAYLISSVTIISIIGLYSRAILSSAKQTIILVIILCFTYTFVYVTLQLQDYALLIGSIGLTAILAFAMYITRNINWYELSSINQSENIRKGVA